MFCCNLEKEKSMIDESPEIHFCVFSLTSKKIIIFLYLNIYVSCYQVDLLKNKFGYDEAINYKEEQDLNARLKRSVCNSFAADKY
jgi:hypothetical protein